MYVIAVYDINEKRVNKILKLMRQYLHWQQRSVFEGELSEAKIGELMSKCNRIIKDEDTIKFYMFESVKYFRCEILGNEVRDDGLRNFI